MQPSIEEIRETVQRTGDFHISDIKINSRKCTISVELMGGINKIEMEPDELLHMLTPKNGKRGNRRAIITGMAGHPSIIRFKLTKRDITYLSSVTVNSSIAPERSRKEGTKNRISSRNRRFK